ncbi:TIGR03118 family protein [Singulisphaera sp. GP187]|uniref:TIGR03118 family protein n=1 Tax=Singulisphaera sp. GP187 TaxID=1882752 RepID=UPI00092BB944|nr:TIGR03118 family protein [Singulisphaera sp. GP187]SIO56499.1 TIGR03118 family protein [Singulisphaera sp. GP187]
MLFPLWTGSRTREYRSSRVRNRRSRARRPSIESLDERCLLSADVVIQWNQAVLTAIRNEKPTIGFLTRDLAIVQSAIYDAVNGIDHTSSVFHVQVDAPADASPVAAAAAAGLFTASALFPTDAALFQATYQASLANVPDGRAKTDGIAVGRFVAEQTLIWRATDGANAVVNDTPGTNPGDWRPTPTAFAPAQTPQWPDVTPFALNSGSQFRPGPPPALTSPKYTAAFNEVKDFGRVDSTVRTAQQTDVARFWEGKAGTPQIAGYWNEIAESAALSQNNTLDQNARLFAELNVALADETIAFFDAKYTYNRWRPVTAIQLAGQDGNPDTVADPNWLPLNNTANHPSWVSAHGGISGAAAATLDNFFGTDNISFRLTSEDLKGETHSFSSFSAAATEAENSVVWSGNHFRFDVTAGDAQGRSVAQFIDQNFFKPLPGSAYQQTNLVSNVPGLAPTTDPNLQNPWGLSQTPDGQFRVADNHAGVATLYDASGHIVGAPITIPTPPGVTPPAAPNGNVFNTTSDFVISHGGKRAPATVIFSTEDGTIVGFNPTVDRHEGVIAADLSQSGAVFKTLTAGTVNGANYLYASDFHNGTVDVIDKKFQLHSFSQDQFTDPGIPAGFAPFGLKNVNGTLFVTYAKQDDARHDDVAGVGNGFIDEFTLSGQFITRFASQGLLNSPHGIAVAPDNFGQFSNALLVGNFGDSKVNAFDLKTGAFLGQLSDAQGHPLILNGGVREGDTKGLWGLTFGNGHGGAATNSLFFAAGINDENNGLFGKVTVSGEDFGHNGIVVKTPHFYEHYVGPQLAQLNAVAAAGERLPNGNFEFFGVNQGAIDPKVQATYVFGIDRNGKLSPGPFPDRPDIRFDAVVVVTLTPGQAPTASVTDLTTNKSTNLPRGSVLIRGQVIAVNVPGGLLPSMGLDPSQYRFNYWAKDGNPGATHIASFAPEFNDAQVGWIGGVREVMKDVRREAPSLLRGD